MTKNQILEFARQSAEAGTTLRPSFSLFRRTYQGFAESLDAAPSDEFASRDYEVMSQLRGVFAAAPGETALWACVFIEVWFGNNFTGSLWQALVRINPSNASCAVEHCYHVWAGSGADGSSQLARLLDQTGAWTAVEPKLREIAELTDWSRVWITRLRSKGQETPRRDAP